METTIINETGILPIGDATELTLGEGSYNDEGNATKNKAVG